MAYEWKDNPVALEHDGTLIYHIHIDDFADQPFREFWFATTPFGSDNDDTGCEFDVRELTEWDPDADDPVNTALRKAIDHGTLRSRLPT